MTVLNAQITGVAIFCDLVSFERSPDIRLGGAI
jgi:hypothetical protein